MDIIVYALNIASLDTEDARWRRWLHPARRAAVNRYHFQADQARCLGAGLLLAFAVRQHDPRHELPPAVEITADKKPFLPALPEFHFNLSHSGDWVACASGDVPLGVDIERIDRTARGVAQRYFSPAECAYLEAQPEHARHGAFFDIWTLKESYMKATGMGMRLPLQEFSILPVTPPLLTHTRQTKPYTPALCNFEDDGYRLAVTVRRAGPISPTVRIIVLDDLRQALGMV